MKSKFKTRAYKTGDFAKFYAGYGTIKEVENTFYMVEFLDENGFWCRDEGSETFNKEFALQWQKDASKNCPPENFRTLKIEVIS
jgi:hypothetical protein